MDIGDQVRNLATVSLATQIAVRCFDRARIPDAEWTPICASNFNQQRRACEDLGFSGFLGYTETNVDTVNDGNWRISDGWREDYAYGKHPRTQLGSKLSNDKPNRNI